MKIPVWTVDAFTKRPFQGNPAAVCILEDDIEASVKQSIATEMNISETCFLTKSSASGSFSLDQHFGLRHGSLNSKAWVNVKFYSNITQITREQKILEKVGVWLGKFLDSSS